MPMASDFRIDTVALENKRLKQQLEQARVEENQLEEKLAHLITAYEYSKRHVAKLAASHDAVVESASWKLTYPVRRLISGMKKLGSRCVIFRFFVSAYKNGWQTARLQYQEESFVKTHFQGTSVAATQFLNQSQLCRLVQLNPSTGPVISIVVPLYNTPEAFLTQMLDSVINQTYPNWELCLADASDADHQNVEQIIRGYCVKFPKIRYNKLAANRGISYNTNEALKMVTGDWVALLDHDDILHPAALYFVAQAAVNGADFVYTDELTFDTHIENVLVTHYKPDFAPDTLRSVNYVCHFTAFSQNLRAQVGYFDPEMDGSQDYDMILRLTEKAKKIVHVPHVLYYWRMHATSVASDISAKPYCVDAAKKALQKHYERLEIKAHAELIPETPGFYKTTYAIKNEPLISIVIPNKDHVENLDLCVQSILKKSTYANYEILVIENNSEEEATFCYYKELEEIPQIRIFYYKGEFNYSKINNFAQQQAKGQYLLLLNNDVEIITPNWLQEMLMYAQRPDVGAVGALLWYPNERVQHGGVVMGVLGLAGHMHKFAKRGATGYMGRLLFVQNVSAVTAACLMVETKKYIAVGGLEEAYAVAFNDVDFCMKLRKEGFLNIFTPFAQLYHYESVSRGSDEEPDKRDRFLQEVRLCQSRWKDILQEGDPYYNPNLSLNNEDFDLDPNPII